MRRTESTQNVKFAVLVAAYVLACAAVPSARFGATLVSGGVSTCRQPISIVRSFSSSPAKFQKQIPTTRGGAPLTVALWSGFEVNALPVRSASFHSSLFPEALLIARASTGAMTPRFLAAS
jgi:hypothetical protein